MTQLSHELMKAWNSWIIMTVTFNVLLTYNSMLAAAGRLRWPAKVRNLVFVNVHLQSNSACFLLLIWLSFMTRWEGKKARRCHQCSRGVWGKMTKFIGRFHVLQPRQQRWQDATLAESIFDVKFLWDFTSHFAELYIALIIAISLAGMPLLHFRYRYLEFDLELVELTLCTLLLNYQKISIWSMQEDSEWKSICSLPVKFTKFSLIGPGMILANIFVRAESTQMPPSSICCTQGESSSFIDWK